VSAREALLCHGGTRDALIARLVREAEAEPSPARSAQVAKSEARKRVALDTGLTPMAVKKAELRAVARERARGGPIGDASLDSVLAK
jgi:hypothetical protein